MKLSTKISVGFGLLIVIAMALGGMAVYNMKVVAGHTEEMKDKYVAEVAILSQLERRTQRTMYNMRGYAMSEDEKYLELGKKDLELVKKSLAEAKQLADQFTELVKLRANVGKCLDSLAAFEELSGKMVSGNKKKNALRSQMYQAANEYMTNCNDYLSGQNKKIEAAIASNAGQDKLRDRVFKITVVNDIIDLGNDVRVKNFISQATWILPRSSPHLKISR